jgi:transcriptional regulator of acetoin/glycerol metabolism
VQWVGHVGNAENSPSVPLLVTSLHALTHGTPQCLFVGDHQWRRSWDRCRTQFSLRPDVKRGATYVSREDLRRRRLAMGSTFDMAIAEMRRLHALMPYEVGLSLTDADGVIVAFVGGGRFSDEASRAGMREGAIWSEAAQGTNGMGTCLAVRQPVLIRHNEHFLQQNAVFACCAAPLHDPQGRIAGVLNISCHEDLGGSPAAALVMQAAQAIESRTLLVSSRSKHVLRFHPQPAFVTTAGEALLIVESDGRVAGGNQNALAWLTKNDGTSVIGAPVEQVLGLTLEQLTAFGSPHPKQIPGTHFHGVLQIPLPVIGAALVPGTALATAERRALAEVLDACDWNVAGAARSLGLARKTVYRKLQRFGLVRPGRML